MPYNNDKSKEKSQFANLDDTDLQRHKIDYKLWDGFFVPPMDQIQTASISKQMLDDNLANWHQSLSRVEPLTLFEYKRDPKNTETREIGCKHRFKEGDLLWRSEKAHETMCHKCATLLQFSECIRKFVLEAEYDEVRDYTVCMHCTCLKAFVCIPA